MTEEQNAAISKAEVEAHVAPKPPPPPREKVPEEKIDHFVCMARAPAPKPVDSDYERQIRKSHQSRLQKEASSSSSQQAAGKKQENRSPAGRTGGAIYPPACCANNT